MKRPMTFVLILVSAFLVTTASRSSADEKNSTSQTQAKSPNWPWTKLVAPKVPGVKHRDWGTNPIDAFVLAKLEKKEFEPAPLASPRAVLRRVHFGLVGLPPSPEQVKSFLQGPRRVNILKRPSNAVIAARGITGPYQISADFMARNL